MFTWSASKVSLTTSAILGTLISRWGHILKGERKQLLAAGAGAGLSAAFAAPLSSSLLVIESIERFDAPKTAITTLLAGVVAGGVASWMFPTTPYHLISAVVVFIDHSLCHIVNRDESDRWRRAVFDDAGNEWNS